MLFRSMRQNRCLKELAEEFGAQGEYRQLHKMAQLGKAYEKQLQDEVVRLCLVLELGVAEPVLRAITEKVGAEELMKLKSALEKRMEESLPKTRQLGSWEDREEAVESGFLI